MNNWEDSERIIWVYLVPFLVGMIVMLWVGNFIKLTDCEFKAPYKCEVIHGIGIIPLFSLATVWFDTEEEK